LSHRRRINEKLSNHVERHFEGRLALFPGLGAVVTGLPGGLGRGFF